MFLYFAIKMAFRNMWIRKMRTFLTILAISWSVATLVALTTLGVGIRNRVADEIGRVLRSDIIIAEESIAVPSQVTEIIRSIPHVDNAVGTIFVPAKIGKRSINIIGIPSFQLDFFELKMIKGDIFNSDEENEILLDENVYRSLGSPSIGSNIRVTISYGSFYEEATFRLKGVFKSGGFFLSLTGISFAIVPLSRLQDMLDRKGFVNYIFIKTDDKKMIEEVSHSIKSIFPKASLIKETDIASAVTRVLDIVHGMLMAITLIGLLVAAMGVMNTVMMSIRERIREIGIMKALGARGGDIFMIFIIEIVFMGIIGGLLGIFFGYIGSFALKDLVIRLGLTFNIVIEPQIDSFIEGFLIAIFVSILSASYPILKAVRIRPLEAIRFE